MAWNMYTASCMWAVVQQEEEPLRVFVIKCKVGQMVHWKSQQKEDRSSFSSLSSGLTFQSPFRDFVPAGRLCLVGWCSWCIFLGRLQSFSEMCWPLLCVVPCSMKTTSTTKNTTTTKPDDDDLFRSVCLPPVSLDRFAFEKTSEIPGVLRKNTRSFWRYFRVSHAQWDLDLRWSLSSVFGVCLSNPVESGR